MLPSSYNQDQLFRNALLILASRGVNAVSGFFFWNLAARYYSISDVGMATAILSYLGLITIFSRVGVDVSLIRFMPSTDKNVVFNSSLWLTNILSIALGLIFIEVVGFISPSLIVIKNYIIVLIIIILFNSIILTQASTFVASRQSKFYLLQNAFLALRVPLLIPFAIMGGIGIVFSTGIAYVLASVVSFATILKSFKISITIDSDYIKDSFNFSMMNYISTIFNMVPVQLLPIIIINLIGPENAAKYYIAFTISNIAMMIPDSISTSFFVEGCYRIDLRRGAVKSLIASFLLLIPIIAFFYIYGIGVLGLFGKKYIDAYPLLILFLVSNILVAVYSLFTSYVNIIKKVHWIIISEFLRSVTLLGLSYGLLKSYGILGIGYAWLATYIILTVYVSYRITQLWRIQGVK